MCFLQGYQYKTILKFLGEIKMSLRTLKTRLKQLKLGRRNLMNETTTAVLLELSGPSSNSGYRSIWRRLSLFHGYLSLEMLLCLP